MKTKTKIPHLILAGLLGTGLAAHAAIVQYTTFDANGGGTGYKLDGVNLGGLGSSVSSAVGGPTIYSFTLINDLDGGGINDTLTFDLVYTLYTGSTISGGNVTLGPKVALSGLTTHFGQNYVGEPDINTLQAGDSFSLSIQNINYTDGEGNPDIARFLGFEDMHKFGGGTEDLLLGTTGYTALSVGASGLPVDFGGFVEDLVLTTSITSGSTAQRLRDLQFSFEVVPEPSSTALLGLGGLALMLRRKRSAA